MIHFRDYLLSTFKKDLVPLLPFMNSASQNGFTVTESSFYQGNTTYAGFQSTKAANGGSGLWHSASEGGPRWLSVTMPVSVSVKKILVQSGSNIWLWNSIRIAGVNAQGVEQTIFTSNSESISPYQDYIYEFANSQSFNKYIVYFINPNQPYTAISKIQLYY